MRVWRIATARHAQTVQQMLSGDGAARFGGRWNPKGFAAIYCSENSSLAALEILANIVRPSVLPAYSVLDLDIPDSAIVATDSLAGDTRVRGAALLRQNLALSVPSAVNRLERNIVVNPRHPQFSRVVPGQLQPFVFDARVIR